MRRRRVRRRFRVRIRLPKRTVRLRLTILYGGLFFLAGVAVLVVTYVLVHHSTARIQLVQKSGGGFRIATVRPIKLPRTGRPSSSQARHLASTYPRRG